MIDHLLYQYIQTSKATMGTSKGGLGTETLFGFGRSSSKHPEIGTHVDVSVVLAEVRWRPIRPGSRVVVLFDLLLKVNHPCFPVEVSFSISP